MPVAFGSVNWDLVDVGGVTGSQAGLFSFFNTPVNVYTNTPLLTDDAPFGNAAVNGGAYPSGIATTNSITMDLSAWTAAWGITNFNQGNSAATGTYDSTTGAFTVGWASTIVGGPFAGQTGYWQMSGIAAAVPEASTYAMMLAGLGLIGAMVGRRRKML